MTQTTNIIERAYQLAEESADVEEIRSKLKREGYPSVDAHLSGPRIRSDLTKIIRRDALAASSNAVPTTGSGRGRLASS
jgi:hypothetical protein